MLSMPLITVTSLHYDVLSIILADLAGTQPGTAGITQFYQSSGTTSATDAS